MRRLARLWVLFLRDCLVREMTFRGNFLARAFVESIWFGMLLVFYEILFSHVDRLGDWGREQVLFLVSTHLVIRYLFEGLFLENCERLPELVRTGELDFVLARPVPSQFLVSCRRVDFAGLLNIALGLALCLVAAGRIGLSWTPARIATYALLVANGVVICYAIMFVFAATSLWTVRNEGLLELWHQLSSFARLPRSIVPVWLRFPLTTLVPVLVIANFPAEVIVKALDPGTAIAGTAAGAVLLLLSHVVWRRGLRAYQSASS